MPAILSLIIRYAAALLPALPTLITGIEHLFKGTPKSGAEKWIAIEQALSQSIAMVTTEISQVAPNTSADKISATVAKFTKAVNDGFVQMANELGVFPHSP